MIVVIISKQDIASYNICEHLLQLGRWEEVGEFQNNPLYQYKNHYIITIIQEHILYDNLDIKIASLLDEKPECIIYASRHRSESGRRSLTVHPIGNFFKAEFGGRSRTLVPSAPGLMTEALRNLWAMTRERELDYSVSFEATHHGPFLQIPSFFIEIGSSEMEWRDDNAASVIAQTILDTQSCDYPVAIGVGGGHYAPRITDVALEREISFGHIVPSYAVQDITIDLMERIIEATPRAEFAYFHRKHLKGGSYIRLKEVFEDLGIQPVRSADLRALRISRNGGTA
jgi:D-aminoacyl-tRNA deacylase